VDDASKHLLALYEVLYFIRPLHFFFSHTVAKKNSHTVAKVKEQRNILHEIR